MLRSHAQLRLRRHHRAYIYAFHRTLQSKAHREVINNTVASSSTTQDEEVQPTFSNSHTYDDEAFDLRKSIKLYKTLSKWNLSVLNGVVTGSTAFMCSGGILLGCSLPATVGCISLAISASTLNQVQEYKYDRLMLRTKLIRPLCTGKLSVTDAKIWSALSMVLGMSTLSVYCGSTSAVIGLSTLFMYNAIYTPLKRITPYNTEFGAIVGALPPQIGIAASHYYHGSECVLWDTLMDPLSWYTFLLLYIWQMPHFLFLAIRNKHDYIRGGFKMWSSAIDGDNVCKRRSLLYSTCLLPLPMLMSYSNLTSYMFAIDGTILNALYFASVYRWYSSEQQKHGKQSFYCNLLYLPAVLFLMTLHSKRWKYKKGELFSTHLAWLQDKGISLCMHQKQYESSELPSHAIACTSPFRNDTHSEQPVQTLNITDCDAEYHTTMSLTEDDQDESDNI